MIENIKNRKDVVIDEVIDYQKIHYPNRTTEYEKCKRDLGFIFDSFVSDLETMNDFYTKKTGSMFWRLIKRKPTRLIKEYQAEIALHKILIQKMTQVPLGEPSNISSVDIDTIIRHLNYLQQVLENIIINGPVEDVKIPNTAELTLNLLASARINYKPLTGHVNTDDINKIIFAASGMTPALCNEYNYRVDIVPERLKETLFNKTITWSKRAEEKGEIRYARDVNEQLKAPLLLCWSLRWDIDNKNFDQFCGPVTKRDPNMLAVGFSIWNTILMAESLGYKTGLAQMTDKKQVIAKEVLGLKIHNSDDQYENYTFMPVFFLAVGSQGIPNANTRPYRTENIFNKLEMN